MNERHHPESPPMNKRLALRLVSDLLLLNTKY